MNPRLEKKISKKLVNVAPIFFKDSWINNEPTELAEGLNSTIKGCYSLGGGVDYWGEGEDYYSVYEWFRSNYRWFGEFDSYPQGHKYQGWPNTSGFKPTVRNLLKLASSIELKLRLKNEQ